MRFLASANFLCAIGVFFLPWIDVRCEPTRTQSYQMLTQSGYEIAEGKSTEGDGKAKMEEDMKKGFGLPVNPQQAPAQPKQIDRDNIEKVPVLWGFVAALGVGAVLCLIVPGKLWRAGAVIAVLGALGVLGYQTNEGFPVAKQVKTMQAEMDGMFGGMKALGKAAGGGKGLPGGDEFIPRFTVAYQPGFYLAWALSALPILWILLDVMIVKPQARRDPHDEYQNERKNPFNDD